MRECVPMLRVNVYPRGFGGGVNIAGKGTAAYAHQSCASAVFGTLGIPLIIGRDFAAAEVRAGGLYAAILSYPLWREYLANDPRVLGRSVLLL